MSCYLQGAAGIEGGIRSAIHAARLGKRRGEEASHPRRGLPQGQRPNRQHLMPIPERDMFWCTVPQHCCCCLNPNIELSSGSKRSRSTASRARSFSQSAEDQPLPVLKTFEALDAHVAHQSLDCPLRFIHVFSATPRSLKARFFILHALMLCSDCLRCFFDVISGYPEGGGPIGHRRERRGNARREGVWAGHDHHHGWQQPGHTRKRQVSEGKPGFLVVNYP